MTDRQTEKQRNRETEKQTFAFVQSLLGTEKLPLQCDNAFVSGMMWSVAQLLILFDHAILALLFLIAIFCVITAVSTSLFTSSTKSNYTRRRTKDLEVNNASDEEEFIERTDTCYSVRKGTSVLYESDLNNVV